eukprot:GFUD01026805.1.p1 GENE.GFUD01026805.1~~GFUD01026805.1.p1  ORF type:complete len:280 (-),score=75.79 GFUD01026805.1:36-875(-)
MSSNNNDYDHSTYARRCVSFGSCSNTFLLKHQDEAFIEKMVEKQVELLGGNRRLYNRIDSNMKNGDLDHFFVSEHCAIYNWRDAFFGDHFPDNSWFTVDLDNENEFEYHPEEEFITIPYQLTRHFDRMVALASAKVSPELSWLKMQTYFEKNELLSYEAECKYSWEWMTKGVEEEVGGDEQEQLAHCEDNNLGFSKVAHIIAEVHQTGPKKLEEIALKAVLLHHISGDLPPADHLPKKIYKKAVNGMYNVEGDTPDNISVEGKEMFERMRNVFGNNNSS